MKEIKPLFVDEDGLPLADGPIASAYGWLDCGSYPYVQISPREFCQAVNELFKGETGRYCSGLRDLLRWGLNGTHDINEFFSILSEGRMQKYRGIGKKAAEFIQHLIGSDGTVIAARVPFLLIPLNTEVNTDEGSRRTFERWLLAVDTRLQVGYKIAKEVWLYSSIAYNHRLRVVRKDDSWKVHYMVDDIMLNQFVTLRRG